MAASTTRGERTRDEILSAATQVVLESGPDSFSLREVARRADLAPSALYNHFANREALIIALAFRALGALGGYLSAVPECPTATERLERLGLAYRAFAREHPQEYRLVFECLQNPPTDWTTYITVADPFLVIIGACEAGLASGELHDTHGVGAAGMAYALWTLCHGHASLTARNLAYVDGDFEALAAAGVTSMLAGFRKDS
ncbi:MAG: TetR/AcrR family transcriptional regulator [Coriobacteriia bacterium]|nr:TetR/AcrR family transcriptional regulator [Coriobacteriia bacterium]